MVIRPLIVSALLLVATASALGADPVLGTWKLNLAKSRFSPGPAPRAQIRTYIPDGNGVTATVITIDARGESTTATFTAHYDGKEYPVKDSPTSADELVYLKLDDHTAEVVLKHGDRVIATSVRTVSDDAKTLTMTYRGFTAEGTKIDNLSVYDRQ